jgi:hypothetical protein
MVSVLLPVATFKSPIGILANEVPVVPVTATTTPFNLNSIVDKSTGVTVEDDISGL